MKIILTAVALSTVALLSTTAFAEWDIDATHSSASFAVQHMMFTKVRGDFTGVTGKIDLNEKNLAKSRVDVAIDASTVNTRDAKRDGHLKAADFFNVAKYPKLTFKSTKIIKSKDGYKVIGDLTIRGVTKPVTLAAQISKPMKNPWGMTIRGVRATTTINRKDFNIVWNKALDGGGVVVGNDVEIEINVELSKKTSKNS